MYLTATPMPSITITPPGKNSSKFPGNAQPLDSPGELCQELLNGEPDVEGVLAMMQYKLYCKESKYETPLEFADSEDYRLISETWDALMRKDWKLEIFP